MGIKADRVFDHLAQQRDHIVIGFFRSSQVEFLLPRACPLRPGSSDVQALLAVGLQNMVRCEVVVPIEHTDTFIPQLLMQAPHLAHTNIGMPHKNAQNKNGRAHFISNSTSEFIRSFQQFYVDAQLHSFVVRLASARALHARNCKKSAILCTSSCSTKVSKQELDLLRATLDENCKT